MIKKIGIKIGLVLLIVAGFLSYFFIVYDGGVAVKNNDDYIYLGDTYLRGDVNEDGKVTSQDYLLVKKHVLKLSELSSKAKLLADMNDDGNVTSIDCIKIRKIVLSLEKGTTIDIPENSNSSKGSKGSGNLEEATGKNGNLDKLVDASNNDKLVSLSNYKFPNVVQDTTKKTYKILVIDIDPVLTKGSVDGVSCKGKTASECLGQNKSQAINELIADFKYSSHGYLNPVVVKTEKINEFATYVKKIQLVNGNKAYRLDEDTWLDIMKTGWYDGLTDKRVTDLGYWFGQYDYNYIIKKLNLVARRNNKEFDEVWLVNVDPSLTWEAMMVGRNAFHTMGEPIEKDCKAFRIVNVSISRPDANYECFGHDAERLMNAVFSATNYSKYNSLNWDKNTTSIDSSNYNKLSLWQKFMLEDYQNKKKNTGLAGVGNMHFSPNSTTDYNWNNKANKVYSKWQEWENYPNITNNTTTKVFDPNVYMKNANTI